MTNTENSVNPRVVVIPNDVLMADLAEHIAQGRTVELLCRGNSMNPFLADRRDSLLLSPVNPDEVKVGDVILARVSTGHFVVHRVISLNPIRMNGDGNLLSARETVVTVMAVLSGYKRKGRYGKVTDLKWRVYSAVWAFMGKVGFGNWNLRRIYLSFWRRTHSRHVHIG